MAVTAYGLGGMTPERMAEINVVERPNYLAFPYLTGPCVGLYSDTLNQWSPLYYDDPALTGTEWAADPLILADTEETNRVALAGKVTAAVASFSVATPSAADLGRAYVALARLFLPDLTSQAGS